MTLLLPDKSGLKAETVLHNLKHHVKSINRNWRQEYKTRFRVITAIEKLELPITEPEPPRLSVGDKVGYVKPPEEVILPITVKEEPVKEPARSQPEPLNFKRPNFIDLQKIDQNSEKIKFVLSKCLEIETTHITRSPQDYRDRLMELCEWQEFGNRSAGKALSSLVSNEYLQELRGDRNKHIGYVLTPKSKRLIGVHCETLEPLHKRPEQPKAPEPPPDYKPLVRSLRAKADEVSNACRRLADREEYLETLKQQRQEIDQKISEAEKEIEHLVSVVVPNQEVAVALSRFAAQPVAYKDPS